MKHHDPGSLVYEVQVTNQQFNKVKGYLDFLVKNNYAVWNATMPDIHGNRELQVSIANYSTSIFSVIANILSKYIRKYK